MCEDSSCGTYILISRHYNILLLHLLLKTFITVTHTTIISEPCLEGEVRLNNLYTPKTIQDYFKDPYQLEDFFIKINKEELAQGKVEICVDGMWGTICEGGTWNNNAASVACHQLGFSRFGMYVRGCQV